MFLRYFVPLLPLLACVSASSCEVGQWSKWDECRGSCRHAIMIRNREVLRPRIPSLDVEQDLPCPHLYEIKTCLIDVCARGDFFNQSLDGDTRYLNPGENCRLSEWGKWGPCEGPTCPNGWTVRNRDVVHPRISEISALRNPCAHMYEVKECKCPVKELLLTQVESSKEKIMSPISSEAVPASSDDASSDDADVKLVSGPPQFIESSATQNVKIVQPEALAPPLANRPVGSVVRTNRTRVFGQAFTLEQLLRLAETGTGFIRGEQLKPEDFQPISLPGLTPNDEPSQPKLLSQFPTFTIVNRRPTGERPDMHAKPMVVETVTLDTKGKVIAPGPIVPNVAEFATIKTTDAEDGPTGIKGDTGIVGANEVVRKPEFGSHGEIRFPSDKFAEDGKEIHGPNPAPSGGSSSFDQRDMIHLEAKGTDGPDIEPGVFAVGNPDFAIQVDGKDKGSADALIGNQTEFLENLANSQSICRVSKWLSWSDCMGNCSMAYQMRERLIIKLPPAGVECPRHLYEVRMCIVDNCTADIPTMSNETKIGDMEEKMLKEMISKTKDADEILSSVVFKKSEKTEEAVLEGFLIDNPAMMKLKKEQEMKLIELNSKADVSTLTQGDMNAFGDVGSGELPEFSYDARRFLADTDDPGLSVNETLANNSMPDASVKTAQFYISSRKEQTGRVSDVFPDVNVNAVKLLEVSDDNSSAIELNTTEIVMEVKNEFEPKNQTTEESSIRTEPELSSTIGAATTEVPTSTVTQQSGIPTSSIAEFAIQGATTDAKDLIKTKCAKIEYRATCPDGSTSQPVVRWFRIEGRKTCNSYLYSYCGERQELLDNPIRYEEDCNDVCFTPREKQFSANIDFRTD